MGCSLSGPLSRCSHGLLPTYCRQFWAECFCGAFGIFRKTGCSRVTSSLLICTVLLWCLLPCQAFSYPDGFLAPDLALLCIMAILEALRLYLGSKGNLTEEEAPLGLSLVITVGSMILSVYFLIWQTYVLRADVIINTVLLFTYGLESVFQVLAIAAFVG
ncbi:transmembrane protein 80 isoform X2 [Gallus gallus]|uniref:Transmembrane protein 80 n=1 Tax=Gallus gallus TaxID=9031 RepID=A0A8V0ZMF1_CHICK|nr:transmembrane protein 80 isoform X2 [Gallus gallus]XP_046775030.1 transmembrane protein 80 isoform X2 [Gallus gallus]XP_046798138.1 transmembrane protein 80 isoform X2 [Gallus gallus]